MWKHYNPNPTGRSVGDCAVRAVAVALGVDWPEAYALMAVKGFTVGDMPSSNAVWGAVLRDHGFTRQAVPDSCPDCYTFEDFVQEHPEGLFVLGTGTHVATAVDGVIFDAWDSSSEIPQFVWFRSKMD